MFTLREKRIFKKQIEYYNVATTLNILKANTVKTQFSRLWQIYKIEALKGLRQTFHEKVTDAILLEKIFF